MIDYPNHPIAECYPPLPKKEYEEFKENIRKNGLLHPIVLFEGKILCGIHRDRACKELGITPRYDTPEITDPIAYAIADNERRRHLNQSQKAVVAETLANLKWGSNQFQEKRSLCDKDSIIPRAKRGEVAKKTGASLATMDRVRIAKREGGQHFVEAIKDGKVSADEAYNISRLPKAEHEAALQLAVDRKPRTTVTPSGKKASKAPKVIAEKLKWTPEEEAEDKTCLKIINAPSTFPSDAPIPKSPNNSEAHLRGAINWLRKHEGKIASFKEKDLNELLLRTNAIQAYKVNWPGYARPDGELDERIIDWAQDLWFRKERQFKRLSLAQKLRPPRKQKKDEPLEQKKERSFEDRFKTFWMLAEDSLGLFRRGEYTRLMGAIRGELKQFFSNLSGENRGAAVVADAQKSGPENS